MKVQRQVLALLVVLFATAGTWPSRVHLPTLVDPVAPNLAKDPCPSLPLPSGPVVHVSNVTERLLRHDHPRRRRCLCAGRRLPAFRHARRHAALGQRQP